MFVRHPKMSQEGDAGGAGGAPPVAPEAPTVPTAPIPAAASESPAPAPVVPAALSPEPAPIAPMPEPKVDVAAKLAELEAEVAKQRAENAKLAFAAAFDRAGVAPQYRDYLRSQLGDVDPRSEAGLKAIDDVARKHPAMLTQHIPSEDPMSAFLRAKADEARKAGGGSMWGLIPPDMMRGYAADLGKEGR